MAPARPPRASRAVPIISPRTRWASIWSRACCSASRSACGNLPAPALSSRPAPPARPEPGSLELHVDAFRDVGAEAGRNDDAATDLLRIVVAGPYRIAAGTEERIGVRRLG